MILRPLDLPAPDSNEFLPAWGVVERLQRLSHENCWMITQPSHAALAGEFAAKMTGAQAPGSLEPGFPDRAALAQSGVEAPKLDAALVRAIALHDAGWGIPDAQAIMQSRSVNQGRPKSFVECSVSEFLAAWEKSIDVAASTGPAGGYIVSRHFYRLAEQRVTHSSENGSERARLGRFIESEARRQDQLAAKQERSAAELDLLTDVLQFCDLLSLYVCSGAKDNAEFPEYLGVKVRLTAHDEGYRLDPPIIETGADFAVAALRHPASKQVSGQQIKIQIW
jgi:hypothetical protein